MHRILKLNDEYIMVLNITYTKNVSQNTAEYTLQSKIVKEEKYLLNIEDLGELQGAYMKCIPVKFYKNLTLNKMNQDRIQRKIMKTIRIFYEYSKALVNEWKDYKDIFKETDKFIDTLSLK